MVLMDVVIGCFVVFNGMFGYWFGFEGEGYWNFELGDVDFMFSMVVDVGVVVYDDIFLVVEVMLSRFDVFDGLLVMFVCGVFVCWVGG